MSEKDQEMPVWWILHADGTYTPMQSLGDGIYSYGMPAMHVGSYPYEPVPEDAVFQIDYWQGPTETLDPPEGISAVMSFPYDLPETIEVDDAEEETAALRSNPEAVSGERAALLQALWLLTTLHGKLEIDVNDPIGMAQAIHAHVTAELEQLRKEVAKTARPKETKERTIPMLGFDLDHRFGGR